MGDASFNLIEKKINDLVGLVTALRGEKTALSQKLEQMTVEAKELAGKVAELSRERDEIKGRVETILARLESIEL